MFNRRFGAGGVQRFFDFSLMWDFSRNSRKKFDNHILSALKYSSLFELDILVLKKADR